MLYGFPAPGNIGCDDGPADGGSFQQHVAHALVVAWQHYAVAVLVKRQRFFLKAVKFCHAVGNKAVYLLPVLLLKKAEQLQMHVKALCPQPAHGAKQLLYPLFAHQTADEQESRRIVSGVRRVDIAVQVYTRTMQNDLFFGWQDVSAAKFYRIGLIFKEYVLYTQKRKLVRNVAAQLSHGR